MGSTFGYGVDTLNTKQDEDTDIDAITQGYVSITPSLLDITDYNVIDAVKNFVL